ncbi:hypothetical protein Btru_007887 [Bulinus truncatus]|nr:hypothetical protein Btru_007887 [Bulinus truncatus]
MASFVHQLVLCVLFAEIRLSQGLNVTFDRSPFTDGDVDYCGQLRCSVDTSVNGNILTIISMLVSDVTSPDRPATAATISTFHQGTVQVTRSDIDVRGSISRFHSDLTVRFTNNSDCMMGSYSCELDFVNVTGQPDSLSAVVSPPNIRDLNYSNAELLSELSARMSVFANTIVSKIDRLTSELAGEMGSLESGVTEIKDNIQLIASDLEQKINELNLKLWNTDVVMNNSFALLENITSNMSTMSLSLREDLTNVKLLQLDIGSRLQNMTSGETQTINDAISCSDDYMMSLPDMISGLSDSVGVNFSEVRGQINIANTFLETMNNTKQVTNVIMNNTCSPVSDQISDDYIRSALDNVSYSLDNGFEFLRSHLQLVLCVVFAEIRLSQSLNVTFDRSPFTDGDVDYCGQLRCSVDTSVNGNILTIISMLVSDVTSPDRPATAATISTFHQGTVQVTRSDIDVRGSISRFHSDLTVRFTNNSDCLMGSYSCELDFVNVTGQPDSLSAVVSPPNIRDLNYTNAELLNELSARMSVFANTIVSKIDRLTSELAGKMSSLESGVTEIKDNIQLIASDLEQKISELNLKLWNTDVVMNNCFALLENITSNLSTMSLSLREDLTNVKLLQLDIGSRLQNMTSGETQTINNASSCSDDYMMSLARNLADMISGLSDSVGVNFSEVRGQINIANTFLETINNTKQVTNVTMNNTCSPVSGQISDEYIKSALDNVSHSLEDGFEFLRSHLQPTKCERNMAVKDARIVVKLRGSMFVFCDTQTDDGGWIVIQVSCMYDTIYKTKTASGDTNFNRTFEEYRNGFGSFSGDLWLGNENLHQLTNSDTFELRIDMTFQSNKYIAHYDAILVEDE